MATINDLISQVSEPVLRQRLEEEINRMNKQKKFGLVFEEHLPECTPLYDVPVRREGKAVTYGEDGKLDIKTVYRVLRVQDGVALCLCGNGTETKEFPVSELVTVAEFGDAIYPQLIPMDTVQNAPDSDLWHTLIQADNYHALQLLEYLYAGKVDCIYIDPPYNTGARDWKYNNDYVDGADSYRHSKWLSMMEKRLKIAKKLLNPIDSVLIVTIDEKEYLHLGCLLEEIFAGENIQMISCQINPAPVARKNQFGRTDEYLYYVFIGDAGPEPVELDNEWSRGIKNTTRNELHWNSLLRTGTNNSRKHSPGCFYPIYVTDDGSRFVGAGTPLAPNEKRESIIVPVGQKAVWPIHTDGSEGCWQCSPDNLVELQKRGFVRLGSFTPRGMALSYLKKGEQNKVNNGLFPITGHRDDGSIIVDGSEYKAKYVPGTQWTISAHDASRNGTNLIQKMLLNDRFDFPKALYSVHDSIRFVVANKPNALIVDFFAGSGTTLHAVNLLNAEDGGHRRCIMVTNNEVSDAEAKELTDHGLKPGDEEWEKLGIAQYVTWPRTVCSIEGHDVNGNPLKGNYIGSDLPMADGFKANAAFFKLGFLDKNQVALGKQFKELLSILWMKAGAIGKLPTLDGDGIPEMLVLPQNKMAVLVDEKHYMEFVSAMEEHPEIETLYFVTDSDAGYRDMIQGFEDKQTYQLYKDYLDNFRINSVRR